MNRTPSLLPVRTAMMLLSAVWLALPEPAAGALRFELEAASTTLGEVSIDDIRLRQGDSATIAVSGIAHARLGPLGNIEMQCAERSWAVCNGGRLTWTLDGASPLALGFTRRPGEFALAGDDGAGVRYRQIAGGEAKLEIENIPASWLPSPVLSRIGLSDLSASLSGALDIGPGRMGGALGIRSLAFDTPDGRFAGAGLALDMDFDWLAGEDRLRLDAEWSAGELLLGSIYLPPPEAPLDLIGEARLSGQQGWHIDRLTIDQADVLSLSAVGRLATEDAYRIEMLDLEIERADIAALWRQGLNSLAGTRGWGQLDPGGTLAGRMRLENDSLESAGLRLSGVTIADGADRVAVTELGVTLAWSGASRALDLDASWQSARLLRIPLGASGLAFRTDSAGTLALVDAFRLPVLDGAFVVERLAWRDWARPGRQLVVDARLEPVDLSALTKTLGWTEFGGRLSGKFPGIQLSGSVIEVKGGLDIDLFGGSARINQLSIERPFGSLPALAADMEFARLDLEQVTGAFEFGRMLGLVSGHIRDLRLLDWQPVRFDAWFETLTDSPQREISQKAVDSISSLSGGGSAAISGTLLRWFDDFPYRKAGLGCRLAENVCRMRGLRDADNGGYVILEGRLIPRLDIIGYQRRVDWPRLLAQLAAATASGE